MSEVWYPGGLSYPYQSPL